MLSYALALYGAQKRHLGEPGPDGPPFPLVQQEGEARSSAPALSVCRKGPGPASAARRRANYRAATATPIPCIAASRFSGWLRVPTRWRACSAFACRLVRAQLPLVWGVRVRSLTRRCRSPGSGPASLARPPLLHPPPPRPARQSARVERRAWKERGARRH